MRHLLLLPALLVSLPARASVHARNDGSDIDNSLTIAVTNERVGGLLVPNLSAVLTVPPRVAQQYHVIQLCHDGTASGWCTLLTATAPHPNELFRAIQTNRHFQFHSEYEFDDCSIPPGCYTGGVWAYRAATNESNIGFRAQVQALTRFDRRKRQWTTYAGTVQCSGFDLQPF
jgi:hypothetical protein